MKLFGRQEISGMEFLVFFLLVPVLITGVIVLILTSQVVSTQKNDITGFVVNEGNDKLLPCGEAELLIQRAQYTSASKDLTLSLFNTGNIPLSGFTAIVTYQGGKSKTFDFSNLLIPDRIIQNIVVKTEGNFQDVIVRSIECVNARDAISQYEIQRTGYGAA